MTINKNVIYQIVNVVTGIRYIGSAVNFKTRKQSHIRKLNNKTHTNKHLENAWHKYRPENFVFEIIDCVSWRGELKFREKYWISKYNFDNDLYNIAEDTVSPMLGRNHTEETKTQLSIMNSGKNHPMWGKRASKESRFKMSESRTGEKNNNWGKKFSQEHKDKIAESQPHRKPVAQLDRNTEVIIAVFSSISEASRETGVAQSIISRVCNKKPILDKRDGRYYTTKTAGGFKWAFVEEVE